MTDQTTETRVAEIEKRAEKASPAPWRAMAEGNQYLDGVTRETLVGASRVDGLVRPWNKRGAAHYFEPEMESTARFKDDDASFIAHARTDIPWLLSQLRAAWKREAALREALNKSYTEATNADGTAWSTLLSRVAAICRVALDLPAPNPPPVKHYCREMLKPGGCQLHNLQCGFPDCDKPPRTAIQETADER